MAVTLKDIAQMAGVHKSTVDKVIHNRPGVSEKKRAEIQKLLEETGYESNPLAKALNYQKKKMKVAVVLLKVDALPEIKRGIDIVLQDFKSFNINVEFYELYPMDPEKQAEVLYQLRDEKISGVVLQPIDSPLVTEASKAITEAGIPLVVVNTDVPESGRMCFVGQNTNQSARTAAKMFSLFLPNGGKLGIISNNQMSVLRKRESIMREYLPTVAPNIRIAETMLVEEITDQVCEGTRDYLQKNPDLDALFVTMGYVADVCHEIRKAGKAGKIVVICYERYQDVAELIKRGEISCSISGRPSEQGRIGMRVLFEHLIYGREQKPDIIYTTNEIFIKENVAEWE